MQTWKRNSISIPVLALLLMWTQPSAHATQDAAMGPNEKTRSCIQEVDGYAYLSDKSTMAQLRDLAFAEARRQAVKNASSYLKTHTTVEDFVLKTDTITSSAEGAVTVLASKDFGIEKNARYHVWIKAEVQYDINPVNQASKPLPEPRMPLVASAPAPVRRDPLTVRVWTDRKQYGPGDKVRIYMRGNRDFYARIVDIMADGNIVQLLPNDYRRDIFFKAGRTYRIPGQQDRFDLKVDPPYGTDTIVVYAAEVPQGRVPTRAMGQSGLHTVTTDRRSLGLATRGISVQARPNSQAPAVEFFEAAWHFTTHP